MKLKCIQSEGDVTEQVRYAVLLTYGQDHIIKEIQDEGPLGDGLFPKGSRSFRVLARSSTCDHIPFCQWVYIVYYHDNRCVAVKVEYFDHITVGELLRCLKGVD